MSDRVRLICIILVILAIIATIWGQWANAQSLAQRIAELPQWQQDILNTPEWTYNGEDAVRSYVGSTYSPDSGGVTIYNYNQVLIAPPPVEYRNHVYDYQHYRQHFDTHNRNTRP